MNPYVGFGIFAYMLWCAFFYPRITGIVCIVLFSLLCIGGNNE